MRILRSGRVFFVAQWILPLPVALTVIMGAEIAAHSLGPRYESGPITNDPVYDVLASAFMVVVVVALAGPPVVVCTVILLLPALASLADRDVRATRRLRWASSVAWTVLWLSAPVAAVGVPQIGRAAELDRLAFGPLWPSHPIDDPAILALGVAACAAVALAWAAALVLAAVGAAVAERRRVGRDGPRVVGPPSRSGPGPGRRAAEP